MSTSASERPATNPSRRSRVPVAGPPPRPSAAASASSPALPDVAGGPDRALEGLWAAFWSPASLKGWAGSMTIHAALLLTLALWYFAPPLHRPIRFDGRLAGSPHGDPEGLTLTGGLNTPLPMPDLHSSEQDSPGDTLMELNAGKLEPALILGRGSKPRAGGGVANDNPGAAEGDGFGLAQFGQDGEVIRGVAVKVGDPQFTLLWDSDADLDLHVIEPGGKEIYWEEPKGKQGGELDVDNTKGFGPENIYWLVESGGPGSAKVKGPGLSGLYQWFVVYWGGFGGVAKPTHWKVRIKHDGKVIVVNGKFHSLNERSRTYTLKVDSPRTTVGFSERIPAESP